MRGNWADSTFAQTSGNVTKDRVKIFGSCSLLASKMANETLMSDIFYTCRNPSDVNQQWGFSPTGQIYSLSKPNLVLTYIENRLIEDTTSAEKSSERPREATSGLQNLHSMNDSRLEPSPALLDKAEENPETGLANLKDEYNGCRYSVALLPKRHADGTQR